MKCFFRILWLLLISVSGIYGEQVNLESYASGFDSIPIAVFEFENKEGEELDKNQPSEIIEYDLEFTGKFKVARNIEAEMSEFKSKEIGLFIDGEYTVEGGDVSLKCYLRDASDMNILLGRKYSGGKDVMRRMVHKFSGEVYDMITGDKNPFMSRITYMNKYKDSFSIDLMDYDGHNNTTMRKTGTVQVFPVFSGGKELLWVGFDRGKPDIYKGSIYSGNANILLYSRYVETSPDVSEVDGKIVYVSSSKGTPNLFRCENDGSGNRQLTFSNAIESSPAWSPDGYHVAFISNRAGNPHIYVIDKDGTNTKRLTFKGKYHDSPSYSPDGKQIAYTGRKDGTYEIFIINNDGTGNKSVTDNVDGSNEYPAWSPDGSHIAFVSTRGKGRDIYSIGIDGKGITKLTHTGCADMPDWSGF
ncbi:MAG: DPP IV N-terminal domain-containing protein [Chitinivibrionales bacterium]